MKKIEDYSTPVEPSLNYSTSMVKELKVIFDHIPKTGGTSIHSILESLVGRNKITEQIKSIGYHKAKQLLSNFNCVSGHIWFQPRENLKQGVFHFTVLRNPIDRIISGFFFQKHDLKLPQNPIVIKSQTDLENYIILDDLIVLEQINNFQTHHFLQLEWDGSNKLTDIEKFNFAKNALYRYDLVGVYNQLTDFVDLLCYECGWPPVKEIPYVNVTSKRPKISEVDPKIIRRLEELNQLDIALYDYATQLFNEKKRQVLHECIERRHREIYNSPMPPRLQDNPSFPLSQGNKEPVDEAPIPADFGNRQLEIISVEVKGKISLGNTLFSGEEITVRIAFNAHIDVENLTVGLHINDRFGRLAYGTNNECLGHALCVRAGGVYFIDYRFRNDLGIGQYTLTAALHLGSSHLSGCFHWRDEVARFEVVGNIGYHFEGIAKLYPQLNCGVLEGTSASIQLSSAAGDWPRLQQIAIHTPKLTEFRARLHLPEPPQHLRLHQVISVEAEITNTSSQTWGSAGQRPVHLSYHWQALDGRWLEFDGERTPLPHDISPGESFRHYLTVKTPSQPGDALLQLTLVQEGVAWFDEQGCPPLISPVSIRE
jgi:hypothetical protein